MTTKVPGGGEFFKVGADGKPSDIELHSALLGNDDKNTWNPFDPRQRAERLASMERATAERKRRDEARKAAKRR